MQAWEGDTNCLNCAIRSTALFSGLNAEDFEKIHDPVEQVTLKPGELLYKVGDTGHHLFTVRSGLIKLVQYLPDGTQRIVRLVKSTDVLGLEVLVNSQYEPGHHSVVWNGKDKLGNDVTSGVYLYKFEAGDFSQTKKMNMLR